MLKTKGAKLLLAVYILLFLAMLLFSFLTPMLKDDYSYCFAWGTNERITSIAQIPASMAVHRQLTNGRVVAHSLVQLILIAPKAVFNLLNALNAVLLAWLFRRHFRDLGESRSALLLILGAFLLWNYMAGFGQVFLWLDGAVNYSWGISLFLLYLWPYTAAWLGAEYRRSTVKDILFLPLAFAAGAYSENGSIATLFAALCLTVLTALREKKLSWKSVVGLVLGTLGFVFLMSAPATSGRSSDLSVSVLADNLRNVLSVSQEALLPLYIIFAVSLAACLLVGADRRRIVLAGILFLAGVGSVACFVFALYFTDRHLCFTIFFTVLACLILLGELLRLGRKTLPVLLLAAMAVPFVFNLALGSLDIAVIYKKSLDRQAAIEQALADGVRDAELEVFMPWTKYSGPRSSDLEADPTLWPNPSIARYYGFDSVVGVWPPES